MLNDLKTKKALSKIFELILVSDVNKLLTIKSSTAAGKLIKKYLINTNIINMYYAENFSLNALDFETQIIVDRLKNLMNKENQKNCFNELIKHFKDTEEISLWICITVILSIGRDSFILFENGQECEISSEVISKLINNLSNYKLLYKPLGDDELDYIKRLSKLFNYENISDKFVDYVGILNAMQQWLLSLPKYTWVITQNYVGKNKYTNIDNEFLKFRDMLKIFPLSSAQTIRLKIPEIFGTDDFEILSKKIRTVKKYFESVILSLEKVMLDDLDYIFDDNFKKWVENLDESKKKFSYENSEEKIFSLIKAPKEKLISYLCDICIGIKLDYFDNYTPSLLFEKLLKIKYIIEKQVEPSNLINIKGAGFDYTLQKTLFNSKMALLSNEIISILQEYGKSLSVNEKKVALLSVLEVKGL